MTLRDPTKFMWTDAMTMLERADRLHRQFFQLSTSQNRGPIWEPPADIFAIGDTLVVLLALPGVVAHDVTVVIDGGALFVVGMRPMPAPAGAMIRRLELPYGRFERHIDLPKGIFKIKEQELSNGCLRLTLSKLA